MNSHNERLSGERLVLPESLWAATAVAAPAAAPVLRNDRVDVLIIGAGFTGLNAAIRLAEAGLRCTVVEAAQPGWGASGRNNGQVIAGLKQDPADIERMYPGALGRKLVRFGSEAPSVVWALIDRYRIDCASNPRGWIQPAFTRRGIELVKARHAAWRERGVDAQLLEGEALHSLLGTRKYNIGWLDPRGGSLQPLSYARGLAKVAIDLGVQLYAPNKVERLTQLAGLWVAQVGSSSITANHVIVATGAYAEDLVPGLRTSFLPVRTAQVATAPLPEAMKRCILPQGQVASDTRQLLTSFRLSPDGRLVMGGSGATAGLDHRAIVPHLQRAGEALFGHLGRLQWAYHWSGYFAVTTDHLPHVHEPAEHLHVAVGCNGRGIAVSTSLGIAMAERVLGASAEDLPVPITRIGSVPFHALRSIGVRAATIYKRLQDQLG